MAAAQIRPLVAGNWKMNGLSASLAEFNAMKVGAAEFAGKADLMICPPATLIAQFAAAAKGSGLMVGGQDCHAKVSGAHTGDISAEMLADAGAAAVIVGHSERRTDHHETDAVVKAKALAAWRERRAGRRRQPESRRFPWNRRGLPVNGANPDKGGNSAKYRVETAANSYIYAERRLGLFARMAKSERMKALCST